MDLIQYSISGNVTNIYTGETFQAVSVDIWENRIEYSEKISTAITDSKGNFSFDFKSDLPLGLLKIFFKVFVNNVITSYSLNIIDLEQKAITETILNQKETAVTLYINSASENDVVNKELISFQLLTRKTKQPVSIPGCTTNIELRVNDYTFLGVYKLPVNRDGYASLNFTTTSKIQYYIATYPSQLNEVITLLDADNNVIAQQTFTGKQMSQFNKYQAFKVHLDVPPAPALSSASIGIDALSNSISVTLPQTLLTFLDSNNIQSLKDIRRAGGLKNLAASANPPYTQDGDFITLFDSHSRLELASQNYQLNNYLISKGYPTIHAIASGGFHDFVNRAADAGFSDFELANVYYVANSQRSLFSTYVTGLRTGSFEPAFATNSISNLMQQIQDECNCDDCHAAVSPFAYLSDLIQYITGIQNTSGNLQKLATDKNGVQLQPQPFGSSISLSFLEDNFCQSFGSFTNQCDQLNQLECIYRLQSEVLNCYITHKTISACQKENLNTAINQFLQTAYFALLEQNGTSFTEIRSARSDSAKKKQIANNLGIVSSDQSIDTIDALFLDPNVLSPDPRAITAQALENLFGFRRYDRSAFDNTNLLNPCLLLKWRTEYLLQQWQSTDGNQTYLDPITNVALPVIDPDIISLEDLKAPLQLFSAISAINILKNGDGSTSAFQIVLPAAVGSLTVGDTIFITNSSVNTGAFTVNAISGSTVTVNEPLYPDTNASSAYLLFNGVNTGSAFNAVNLWATRRKFIDTDILQTAFNTISTLNPTLSAPGINLGNRMFNFGTSIPSLSSYVFPGSKITASNDYSANSSVFTFQSSPVTSDAVKVIEAIPVPDSGVAGTLTFTAMLQINNLAATGGKIFLQPAPGAPALLPAGSKIFVHGTNGNDGEYTISANVSAGSTIITVSETITDETPANAYALCLFSSPRNSITSIVAATKTLALSHGTPVAIPSGNKVFVHNSASNDGYYTVNISGVAIGGTTVTLAENLIADEPTALAQLLVLQAPQIAVASLAAVGNTVTLASGVPVAIANGSKIYINGTILNSPNYYTISNGPQGVAAGATTFSVAETLVAETGGFAAFEYLNSTAVSSISTGPNQITLAKGLSIGLPKNTKISLSGTSSDGFFTVSADASPGATVVTVQESLATATIGNGGAIIFYQQFSGIDYAINKDGMQFTVQGDATVTGQINGLTVPATITISGSTNNDGVYNLLPTSPAANPVNGLVAISINPNLIVGNSNLNYIPSGAIEDGILSFTALFPVPGNTNYLTRVNNILTLSGNNLADILLVNQQFDILDGSNGNALLKTTSVNKIIYGNTTYITANDDLSALATGNLVIRLTRQIPIHAQTPVGENILNTLKGPIASASYPIASGIWTTPNLSWANYGDISLNNWAPLSQVKNDLINGVNADLIITNLQTNLKLRKDEFIRLVEVYEKYTNQEIDYHNGIVTAAEWDDFKNILINALKRSLYTTWIAEETSKAIDFTYDFFVQSDYMPQTGELPPAFSALAPLLDPSTMGSDEIVSAQTRLEGLYIYNRRVQQLAGVTAMFNTRFQQYGFNQVLNLAFNTLIDYDRIYDNPDVLVAISTSLSSVDPAQIAQATQRLNTEFLLSVSEFNQIVALNTAAANNTLSNDDPNLAAVIALFVRMYKQKRLYPQWVNEEIKVYNFRTDTNTGWGSGIGAGLRGYYRAIKSGMPAWRASIDARSAWQQMLSNKNRPPVVDPDLVVTTDFASLSNAAANLWNYRESTLQWQYNHFFTTVAANDLAKFTDIVTDPNGLNILFTDFTDLVAANSAGVDVRPRLAQLQLTMPMFLRLAGLYGVAVDNSLSLIPAEWIDIINICIQAWKQRKLYLQWNDAETSAGITLSPRFFTPATIQPVKYPTTYLESLIEWRATLSARKAWENLLNARVTEMNSLANNNNAVIKNVEDSTMSILRDALVQACGVDHVSLQQNATDLSKWLLTDFQINCCQDTTRLAFAINTLQLLIWQESVGADNLIPAYDSNGVISYYIKFVLSDPNFDAVWQWMGSYEMWRSAMFVFLYPENLLLPNLKRSQSYGFRQLVDTVTNSARFLPTDACAAAEAFSNYFEDVCNLDVQSTCNTYSKVKHDDCNDYSVSDTYYNFHLFAKSQVTGNIYWNMFTSTAASTSGTPGFWSPLSQFGTNVYQILGSVPYVLKNGNRYIYLFAILTDPTTFNKKLSYLRYDLNQCVWDDSTTDMNTSAAGIDLTNIIMLQRQDETLPPFFITFLNDGTPNPDTISFSTNYLNDMGDDWSTSAWAPLAIDDLGHQITFSNLKAACAVSDSSGSELNDNYVLVISASFNPNYPHPMPEPPQTYAHIVYIKDGSVNNNLISFYSNYVSTDTTTTVPGHYVKDGILEYEQEPGHTEPIIIYKYKWVPGGTQASSSGSWHQKVKDPLINLIFLGLVHNDKTRQVKACFMLPWGQLVESVIDCSLQDQNLIDLTQTPFKTFASQGHTDYYGVMSPPVELGSNLNTVQGLIPCWHDQNFYTDARWVNYCLLTTDYNGAFVYTKVNFDSATSTISPPPAPTNPQTSPQYGFNVPTSFSYFDIIEASIESVTPIVKGMYDVSENYTSDQLVLRKPLIAHAYNSNAAADFNIQEYLREAYYFVPMYLGYQLSQRGYYVEALKWFKTVYDYSQPVAANRKIYDGLNMDNPNASPNWVRPADWLLDPLNPHLIAGTRANDYFKYTVATIAQTIIAYGDSLFTIDTEETVSEADELYNLAIQLLSLDIFRFLPPVCNPDYFQPIAQQVLCQLPQNLIQAYGNNIINVFHSISNNFEGLTAQNAANVVAELLVSNPDNMVANLQHAERFIHKITASLPAPLTMSQYVDKKNSDGQNFEQALISSPGVEAKLTGAATNITGKLTAALVKITGKTTESLPKAGMNWMRTAGAVLNASGDSYLTGNESYLNLRAFNPVSPTYEAQFMLQTYNNPNTTLALFAGIPYVPFYTGSFCVPPNPVFSWITLSAQLNLFKIRNCMNIAGMKRDLDPYSAPTDTTTGLPSIGSGGNLVIPGATAIQPTQYHYKVLIDRAKQWATIAQQMESAFLSALEKRDAEYYNLMTAKQGLQVATATQKLKQLQITTSTDQVSLSQDQQDRAQLQVEGLQQMIEAGLNQYEQDMIFTYGQMADLQNTIAALTAAAGFLNTMGGTIGAIVAGAADTVGTGAALAMEAMAGLLNAQAASMQGDVAGMQATISEDSIWAAQARRVQDWTYQSTLAQQDVKIGAQQVQLSQDQLNVAMQDKAIADLQQQNAQDSVNFLSNKFTNYELYDWMSSVLQRVYAYFLQQATASAKLALNQVAFETQTSPPPLIQASYWESPTDNYNMSSAGSNAPDRRGLTGSAQLLQDIYKVDQYAFDADTRKLQLTKNFSLATTAPSEFQAFRQNGVLTFQTMMDYFDRDFPGHYLRLIKKVKVSIIALVPGTVGINATLTSSGISRVVLKGETFQTTTIRRPPEMIAFTGTQAATGVFDMQPDAGNYLNPFEDSGVDMMWQLQLPPESNLFDFSTIADVVFSIDYTALYDSTYRQQVRQNLGSTLQAEAAISFNQNLADQFYELNNPNQSATPGQVSFSIGQSLFPANLSAVTIDELKFYFIKQQSAISDPNKPFTDLELITVNCKLSTTGNGITTPVASGSGIINNMGILSSTINGQGLAANYRTKSPLGTWTIQLNDPLSLFANGQISDMIMIISYSASLPVPQINF